MGKHEVVKPAGSTSTAKSTDRVRKHREAMRAKGYVLKQRWVIDTRDPAIRERLREEGRTVTALDRKSGDAAWADSFVHQAMADWPDQA
jgi:hypothetical protein